MEQMVEQMVEQMLEQMLSSEQPMPACNNSATPCALALAPSLLHSALQRGDGSSMNGCRKAILFNVQCKRVIYICGMT